MSIPAASLHTRERIEGWADRPRAVRNPTQPEPSLNLDNHLERLGLSGVAECVVGVDDLVQLEAMRDKAAWIELLRLHRLQKHGSRNRIDETGRNRNVLRPQSFKMKVHLLSMNADIGDHAARTYDVLA